MASYDRYDAPYRQSTDDRITTRPSRRPRHHAQSTRPRSPSPDASPAFGSMSLQSRGYRNQSDMLTGVDKNREGKYVRPTEDEFKRMRPETRAQMDAVAAHLYPRNEGDLSLRERQERAALTAARIDGNVATPAMHARRFEEEEGNFTRVSHSPSAFPPSIQPKSQRYQASIQEEWPRYSSSPEPAPKKGILKNAGLSKQPATSLFSGNDDHLRYKPASRFFKPVRDYPATDRSIGSAARSHALASAPAICASLKSYQTRSSSRDRRRDQRAEEPPRTKGRSSKYRQISQEIDRRPRQEFPERSTRIYEDPSKDSHRSSHTESRHSERTYQSYERREDGSRWEVSEREESRREGARPEKSRREESRRKHRRRSPERYDSLPDRYAKDERSSGYGIMRAQSPGWIE